VSAGLNLDADQVRAVGNALAALTEMTRREGVRIGVYMRAELAAPGDDTAIAFSWDRERNRYVLDDRIGD
jgi:hypothetical protein